jgi:hypothetical protein
MTNYKEKLDELRRGAEEKVRELDEKFGLREKFEEGAKFAGNAAWLGAETVKDGAERL